jgi:outer membrane lipoprotein LolB
LQQWQLTGAFSVVAPNQKPIIAHYSWQQQGASYMININSSLDIATATINGNAEQVTMQASNINAPVTARTPERLMQRELGWHLPVSDLRYWLLGMPEPLDNTQGTWDTFGHVSELKQGGFTIRFSNYQHAGRIDYPGIVEINGHGLQVKVVSRNLSN